MLKRWKTWPCDLKNAVDEVLPLARAASRVGSTSPERDGEGGARPSEGRASPMARHRALEAWISCFWLAFELNRLSILSLGGVLGCRRVLVTGASGLLGRQVMQVLSKCPWEAGLVSETLRGLGGLWRSSSLFR